MSNSSGTSKRWLVDLLWALAYLAVFWVMIVGTGLVNPAEWPMAWRVGLFVSPLIVGLAYLQGWTVDKDSRRR